MIRRGSVDQPAVYEIEVEGALSERWFDYLGFITYTVHEQENVPVRATLRGTFSDQAALLGTLQSLCSLGLPLVSVQRIETTPDSSLTG